MISSRSSSFLLTALKFNFLLPRLVSNIQDGIPPNHTPGWTFDPFNHPGVGLNSPPLDTDSIQHLYHYPNPSERESVLVKLIPKKTLQPLKPSSTLETKGWGLYMQQSRAPIVRDAYLLGAFASAAFFVLRWAIANDLQGASGAGALIIAGLSLLLFLFPP